LTPKPFTGLNAPVFFDPGEFVTTEAAIAELRRKFRSAVLLDTVHTYFDRVVAQRVDEERDELAKIALELVVDPAEPLILAAGRRSGPAGAALAAATVMKRRFAKMCRDRLQFDEAPDA